MNSRERFQGELKTFVATEISAGCAMKLEKQGMNIFQLKTIHRKLQMHAKRDGHSKSN
jgi:hypothetical protein